MTSSDGLSQNSNTTAANNMLDNDAEDEDTIKILLSTDNHVGYNEKCEVRGNDSLTAFEEVLQHAKRHDVDMILLGILS